MKSRSTTLNFSAAGQTLETTNVEQAGVPWVMLSPYFPMYETVGNFEFYPWSTNYKVVDGVLELEAIASDFINDLASHPEKFWAAFFSDNSNTFTAKGINNDNVEVSLDFLKNGNIHYINQEIFNLMNGALVSNVGTRPIEILFNGEVIQRYSLIAQ